MSVVNQRSVPSAWVWVAIGRDTRWPSGRRVVNIAISIPSISSYSSSSFFPRGAWSRLRSVALVIFSDPCEFVGDARQGEQGASVARQLAAPFQGYSGVTVATRAGAAPSPHTPAGGSAGGLRGPLPPPGW